LPAETLCPKCRTPQSAANKFCSACGAVVRPDESANESFALHNLFEIARSLSATFDLDDLLKRVGSAAERLTDAEASSILLVDETGKSLVFRMATGEKGLAIKKQLIPIGQGVAGWVAQNCKPLIVSDVGADRRFTDRMDKVSGFVTRSILAVPMLLGGELIGVCEALNKRAGVFGTLDESVLCSLANLAALSVVNARSVQDQRNFFAHMIELLTTAAEARDPRTKGHAVRSAHLACAIGRRLGVEGQNYKDLYYGALLHDLGVIALNDPQMVNQVAAGLAERTAERLHPLLGAELLKGITLLKGVIPLVRHHNELFDGTGHPDRLVGEMIPLGARILCFVENVEELRLSGLTGETLQWRVELMAKAGSGKRFDPKVVETYLSVVDELGAFKGG
jgi:HD-GYP domain-containing protein (c-di-GMP phosphodiesterase class II)